ncbi:MAG: aminotransferase class I/II-fold pyridoxal phosphate-dependent enzyme [Planctomycetes bacterium]|nr:aminotransferase class I/II-fold pyridoxal phosphate-dependent enzyme [Planctomycetota bacterium]HPY75814.1 aminotransferase class I/II-fold pyridoxal phosphate-dependent enzyme [Planctomycetota bacterium]HQB00318.1 aminotransferase class I/II-fold pyridoxal phosphate-dependent enzyme [Planctomycetota bacterium]HRU52490.1 aminotransferase class I/II-fold pyridoxal phosphate-dependent enzyme [Planctomycetota bacterium]
MNQKQAPLYEALKKIREKHIIPFDVPGHKQGKGNPLLLEFLGEQTLRADVNSMKPLDNIGNPISVIKDAEKLLAQAYCADEAFLLVNGTTSGVQAMVMAACQPNEKIILPRNVHESAIHALILSGAIPVYMQPEIHQDLSILGGVPYERVEEAIEEHPDAKAVFLTNPSYYGMASNLKKIIRLAHKKNMLVLVDEAHGALFRFHPDLPISAMEAGADMSAVSLHKTAGSLSQSSALLLNERILQRNYVKTILNLTQTTSASYLLMASLDLARQMLATQGKQIITNLLQLVKYARKKINAIDGYYAYGQERINGQGIYALDPTKLGIKVSELGLTGHQVYDILRDQYNIQMEFGDSYCVLAMLGVGDQKEWIDRLIHALKDIAKKYRTGQKFTIQINFCNPHIVVSPRTAFYEKKITIPLEQSIGKISGESVMAYPPGIPIISPGELISQNIIDQIHFLQSQKTIMTGLADQEMKTIQILSL